MLMRPGSARSVSNPGQTVGRPGSRSGLSSRSGQVAMMSSAGTPHQYSVSDRPLSQHGLTGIRVGTAIGSRQIQDTTYFIGMIRNKMNEIAVENQSMRDEIQKGEKDILLSSQLERRYDSLLQEVRSLEGSLADYNLALDKCRTSVDATEITHVFSAVKRRNEVLSRELDQVFIERQERERGAARLMEQMKELQASHSQKINSLSSAQQQEYKAIVEENKVLSARALHSKGELEELNREISSLEADLQRFNIREEYSKLESRLEVLNREKLMLDEESESLKFDPSEAREHLLSKVKEYNGQIQVIDVEIRAVVSKIEKKKQEIAELQSEIEERRSDAGDSSKYEVLFKKDQEMTEFLDRFSDVRDRELSEQQRILYIIGILKDYIDERDNSETKLGYSDEIKDELQVKRDALVASELSVEKLMEELRQRQIELEKITSADEKINDEISSLSERMKSMEIEMKKFSDIENLHSQSDSAKLFLQQKIEEYSKLNTDLKPELMELRSTHDSMKSDLEDHAVFTIIESAESQLRGAQQSAQQLKEYISANGKETDFERARDICMGILGEVNILVQKKTLLNI